MKRGVAVLLIPAALAAGCSSTDERTIVAAGTTLVDSGFIERVVDDYPSDGQVSVVGGSSREAFALGGSGSAELLITHLPEAEREFLADNPGARQEPVFTSQFVLIGPENGPLAQQPNSDVVELFIAIAGAGHRFVSRADGSGTAAKEQEIWHLAGIDPTGEPWYTETGQGMGFTLQVADQQEAYTLAEVGSYLGAEAITLIPFVGDFEDVRLQNQYRVTLVEGASPAAQELFDWLISEQGREAVLAVNLEMFEGLIYIPAGVQSS